MPAPRTAWITTLNKVQIWNETWVRAMSSDHCQFATNRSKFKHWPRNSFFVHVFILLGSHLWQFNRNLSACKAFCILNNTLNRTSIIFAEYCGEYEPWFVTFYLSFSAVNPIIYSLRHRQFKNAFEKIFKKGLARITPLPVTGAREWRNSMLEHSWSFQDGGYREVENCAHYLKITTI